VLTIKQNYELTAEFENGISNATKSTKSAQYSDNGAGHAKHMRPEQELQMVQLSATRSSCITTL